MTEDLKATRGGIPSNQRTEAVADALSYKWQQGWNFQVVFSHHSKVEIAPSSNKRLKSERGDHVLETGSEGGGTEDVLTPDADK